MCILCSKTNKNGQKIIFLSENNDFILIKETILKFLKNVFIEPKIMIIDKNNIRKNFKDSNLKPKPTIKRHNLTDK